VIRDSRSVLMLRAEQGGANGNEKDHI